MPETHYATNRQGKIYYYSVQFLFGSILFRISTQAANCAHKALFQLFRKDGIEHEYLWQDKHDLAFCPCLHFAPTHTLISLHCSSWTPV